MNPTEIVKNHLAAKLRLLEGTELKIATKASQRTVADTIENMCCDIAASEFKADYRAAKSVRSVDDFSIMVGNNQLMIDVKTHFIQEDGFSMPNLISIKRLKAILEDHTKDLAYAFVDYTRNGTTVTIKSVKIISIHQFDWNDLTIGALGNGQLQIKNANLAINESALTKDLWFQILKTKAVEFYNKQILKAQKQIDEWLD